MNLRKRLNDLMTLLIIQAVHLHRRPDNLSRKNIFQYIIGHQRMIKSVLIFNNHGRPRLIKFYQQIDVPTQQNLVQEIFQLVSKRPDTVCNFLEGSQMLGGSDTRVIYRHYATLYFVFVVDESESELGILDLIQVFVEGLDRCFENVCELDLIFHFEEVHHILAEVVLETNLNEIVNAANESNNKVKKRVGAMASITKSSAGAVARDLGANLANTATNVLQSTMSATLRRTGF
ncbi:7886_t:CDS:2 [Paraglomus occultum]|uniref:7886_t:CDS:1 n=1 Tax=Paraglomus occultum TaxID=144539 RepID=A0A9N9FJN9_9GLOM|nr:7886_t:CDS:2 [Paraglomus occultum]